MSELRAREVAVGRVGDLTEVRCPETGCGRLLLEFRQTEGRSEARTQCKKCGTKASWIFQSGHKTLYKVLQRRV